MAKAKRGEKSAAIREYLAANPGVRTKDVVAALKQQGIRVSGQMVSTLKGKLGGEPIRKRSAAKNNRSPSIDDLIEAKKLTDRLGGVDKARAAIAVLAKLL
jgi:transposase